MTRSTSCALACRVGGQSGPIDRNIARGLRPDLRGVLAHGVPNVDHRRALLIFDRGQLGCVLRRIERLGDDDRDGLADMANRVASERRAMRDHELRAAASCERRMLGHVADPLHVGGGQHRQHAGHGRGGCDIDRTDVGEGVGRADKIGLGLPGHRHVGRKTPDAAYQRVVLQAWLVRRAAFNGLRIHVGFRYGGGTLRGARL